MTPKTQSVCKHCGALANSPFHDESDPEGHKFEPVSEPASTGPHGCSTCHHPIGYHHDAGEACTVLNCECKSYLAARPSEPSAPPKGFDPRPDLNWPLRSMRPAPQTSAEDEALPREAAPILAALFNSLIEQNCPDSVSGYTIFDAMWPKIQAFAAPQPVSGDAPNLEEIAAKMLTVDPVTNQWIRASSKDYLVQLLRPYFPPASTARTNGWIAKVKDLLSEMQMFKDKHGFWLRAEQLLARKSPDSHLGAVRD